jgi:hypothetical protein
MSSFGKVFRQAGLITNRRSGGVGAKGANLPPWHERLHERKETLSALSSHLKSKFYGIDPQIDAIVSMLSSWYMLPEMLTRPTIINLWGITGVGKTDMVRTIASFLDMNDSYAELRLLGKGGSENDGIATFKYASSLERNLSSVIDSNGMCILMLDEFQRFRTITDGGEVDHGDFNELWTLMSDGRFPSSGKNDDFIDYLVSRLDDCEQEYGLFSYTENEMVNIRTWRRNIHEYAPWLPTGDIIRKGEKFHADKFILRLLSAHSGIDIDEDTDDVPTVFDYLDRVKASGKFALRNDFSKILIFVSGNLDEAFTFATEVDSCHIDADDIAARSNKVNILDIKDALTSRFSPEHISRLGNNHVIFPSLTRKAFESIIASHLAKASEKVLSECGVDAVFGSDVRDMIYDNGVYPTQGARPLISTVTSFLSKAMPVAVISAIEHDGDKIVFKMEGQDAVFSICKDGQVLSTCSAQFVPELYNLRNVTMNKDMLSIMAVHEAGHCVVHMSFCGTVPKYISTRPSGDGAMTASDGATTTMAGMIQSCAIGLAGMVSEKHVFGNNALTMGSGMDLKSVTKMATSMIRSYAVFSRFPAVICSETEHGSAGYDTDIASTNGMVKMVIKKIFEHVEAEICANEKLLLAIASALVEGRGYLSSSRILEIAGVFSDRTWSQSQLNFAFADRLQEALVDSRNGSAIKKTAKCENHKLNDLVRGVLSLDK